MYKIKTDSFTLTTDTKKDAFALLLKLSGLKIGDLSNYMEVSTEELQNAPQQAINYLKDIINAELIHLGYVIKDTKTAGLLYELKRLQKETQKAITNGTIQGNQPIELNDDIVSESGYIKAGYITRMEDILKDFINPD